jgi:amino acid transporter
MRSSVAPYFILPSQIAAQVGNWRPIAFLTVGFSSLLVALCFAELGSRFEGTGGPFLYTRAAFGRFVAFEVGGCSGSRRNGPSCGRERYSTWVAEIEKHFGIDKKIAA